MHFQSIIWFMNKRLITLVRHAKSSWKTLGQLDHDRQLNSRGDHDAPMMANRLLARQCIPDLILCSSAVRTQQSAKAFMDTLDMDKDALRVLRSLYLCTPETLLEELASVEEGHEHIMIIGHNPGLEQLSTLLSDQCTPEMPTMGIRHFASPSFTNIPLANQIAQVGYESEGLAKPGVTLVFEDFPKNDQ